MNVLIMTPLNYDEKSPFNHLLRSLLIGMISDGLKINRVVTKVNGCNKNDVFETEDDISSVEYLYVNSNCSEKNNFIKRYIQFWWTQFRMCLKSLKIENVDVLFEDMSYASFLPLLFSKIRKVPVVLMVQDAWPDNAVEAGLISRHGIIYKLFDWLQTSVYKWAAKIVVISEDIKRLLIEKGIESHRIEVIYNWSYSDEINDISWRDNKFVKKFDLSEDKFYAVYAGNIGMMQNIRIIIDAARLLKNNEKINFLIVGAGVKKEEYKSQAINEKLHNVTFIEMQPACLAPHIYSAAGVNIIPLMPNGVRTALPSKTAICLSCGRPVVLCVEKNSKYAQLIDYYSAGMAVGTSNPQKLSETIIAYSEKNISISKENVHKCFKENFLKSVNVKKYCDVIKNIQRREQ